jgi:hypothetical protein
MVLEVRSELNILAFHLTLFIRDKEPGDQPTDQCKSRADQEHALLTLLGTGERVLDWSEHFSSNRCSSFSHCGCEAHVMATQWSREGLCGAEEGSHTRPHLTQGIEDAVEDNEEREDGLNRSECSTEDKSEDAPEKEAQGHRLLATNAVHEKAADNATREVEAIHDSTIANILDDSVVGIKLTYDSRGE